MLRSLLGLRTVPKLVFSVDLSVTALNNLTISTGRAYISWKVLGFGKPSGSTKRRPVAPNPKAPGFAVVFDESFKFNVPIPIDKDTLVLQDEVVKLRVFHESRSGRLFNELGCIFVNLSEYAATKTKRDKAFLLQKSKINGTVVVSVAMERISGFPTYKVPTSSEEDGQVDHNDWDHLDGEDREGENAGVGEGCLSVEMLQSRKVRVDEPSGMTPTVSQTSDVADVLSPGSVRRRNPGRTHIRNVSALAGRNDVRLSTVITESRGGHEDIDDVVADVLATPPNPS